MPLRVDRSTLYAEVWATPMVALAPKYGVSANFLARVCARLNVPCPPRGYWARKRSGQRLSVPLLPPAKRGDPLEWTKGDRFYAQPVEPISSNARTRAGIITGSLKAFTSGRTAGDGYLKPLKRNLPDLIVTETTLNKAASVLKCLVEAACAFGARVAVSASGQGYTRLKLGNEDGRLARSLMNGDLWNPPKPTVLVFNEAAVGITIYEQTVEKEMVYVDGRFISARDAQQLRRDSKGRAALISSWTSKQHVPSGKLCLRAYSPYCNVAWTRTWTEDAVSLRKQCDEIAGLLNAQAAILTPRLLEANRIAAEERRVWEERYLIDRRKHLHSANIKARNDAYENLVNLAENWEKDRRINAFLEDVKTRSRELDPAIAHELLAKIEEASSLLDGLDSVNALLSWASPPPLLTDPE